MEKSSLLPCLSTDFYGSCGKPNRKPPPHSRYRRKIIKIHISLYERMEIIRVICLNVNSAFNVQPGAFFPSLHSAATLSREGVVFCYLNLCYVISLTLLKRHIGTPKSWASASIHERHIFLQRAFRLLFISRGRVLCENNTRPQKAVRFYRRNVLIVDPRL